MSVSAAALALRHGIAGCGSGGVRVGAVTAAAGIVEERRMEYVRVVGEAAETSTWVPAGLLRLSESQAAALLRPRPPRRPRNGSRSAAVRAWVLSLDPCTVFWIHDMPVELRASAPRVLHDMVQEDIPVERICNGFYRRGTQAPDAPVRDRRAKTGHLGIAYAGAGSGYAHIAAVNEVGWTTQVPARAVVAVVGRPPEARIHCVDFVSSANTRRRDLTWAEVTLIEAVRHSNLAETTPDYQLSRQRPEMPHAEAAWQAAMETVRNGGALHRLGRGAVLRGRELAAAAAAEPRPPEWFASRMADVVAWVGHRTEHPDRTAPVRYVTEPAGGNPFRADPARQQRPAAGRLDIASTGRR